MLSDTKDQVLEAYEKYKDEIENLEHLLIAASEHPFYNCSKNDFEKLLKDPETIEQNFIHYLDSFSKNVQEIFE